MYLQRVWADGPGRTTAWWDAFLSGLIVLGDALGPKFCMITLEAAHHVDATLVIQDNHFHSTGSEEIEFAGKRPGFSHNNLRDLELDDGSCAHGAQCERCIEHRAPAAAMASGCPERRHLPAQSGRLVALAHYARWL